MKKTVNQLNRSLFVGFVLLHNLIFSISADQLKSSIENEYSWHNSVLSKSLIAPEQNCGPWPNFETMIKEMKKMDHINACLVSINWYLRQNSYREGKSDNGDIVGMLFGT